MWSFWRAPADSTPRSNVGGGAWATTRVGVIWLVAYVVQDGCNVCAMWDCGNGGYQGNGGHYNKVGGPCWLHMLRHVPVCWDRSNPVNISPQV
jgi:hypothetical protein